MRPNLEKAIYVGIGMVSGYCMCRIIHRKKFIITKLELQRRRLIEELDRALKKSKSCLLEMQENTNDMQLYLRQDTVNNRM